MPNNSNITAAKFRSGAFLFGMFANIQFVILSFLAMLFYSGGYSFSDDPLSALGFTRVAGESNLISSLIFNTSMLFVGISVVLLFSVMLTFFRDRSIEIFFSSTGTIFAVFSGIAMCGAALTPGDINFEAHVAFAPFTFLFGLLMVFFYSIPIFLNTNFPNRYGFVLILYSVFVVITLTLIYMGSAAYTLEGSIIQILSQKVAIYTEVFVLFLLSFGAYRLQQTQDHKIRFHEIKP